MQSISKKLSKRSGFTLTELITVMGLSMLIMVFIAQPLIQSYRMVSAAQGEANTQTLARNLMERITREISNSTGVLRSDGLVAISIPTNVKRPRGSYREVLLEGAKVDFFRPAQGEGSAKTGKGFYNEDIGRYDPTLEAPKGDIELPARQGLLIVRYFIGLKDPLRVPQHRLNYEAYQPGLYNNPYNSPLMQPIGGRDNLYVLYRAEVPLYKLRGNQLVLNTTYFAEDPKAPGKPLIDDPFFFMLRPSDKGDREAKVKRITAWKRRAVIVTELNRYDMILPVTNDKGELVRNKKNVPVILSLIQFRPGTVHGEIAKAVAHRNLGQEGPESARYAPEVYMASRGSWTSGVVRLRPAGTSSRHTSMRWSSEEPYLVARSLASDGNPGQLGIFSVRSSKEEKSDGVELFNMHTYLTTPSPYKFSSAVALNLDSQADETLRDRFIPFVVYSDQGKVVTSFAITEVGNIHENPLSNNSPICPTGSPNHLSEGSQPNLQDEMSILSNALSPVNERFELLWNLENKYRQELLTHPQMGAAAGQPPRRILRLDRSQYAKRFIDLRRLPCRDGTLSPLDPKYGFPRARIVPGSEIIIGPDQFAPEGESRSVQYRRAISRPVGPNQYLINYVDQNEPEDLASLVFQPNFEDNGLRDLLLENVFIPRYRAGYIELNSDSSSPLPEGQISLFYRFQFTDPKDLFLVDYASNQVLSVNLSIANYSSAGLPKPQVVSLTGTALVRNFFR